VPPLPAVPNVIRVTHQFTLGTDLNATTRFHWSYSGTPPSNATCATFATSLMGLAGAHLASLLSSENTLDSISVQDLSSSSGGFGIDTTSIAGTRAEGTLPAGTAVLLSGPIARRYRGGKPRTYWPFGTSTDLLTANQWTTAAQADFINGLSAYESDFDGQTSGGCTIGELVNVSYYEGFTSVLNPITGRTKDVPKLRVGGPIVDILTNIVVNPRPASQRRRNQTV
jgi:hypothetical protein